MRLPRMTTRRWMVTACTVGLMIGAYRLKRRHDELLFCARHHEHWEREFRKSELIVRQTLETYNGWLETARSEGHTDDASFEYALSMVDDTQKDLAQAIRQTSYEQAMARKYRRAARYPWLSLAPDPPDPIEAEPVKGVGQE